MGKPDNDREVVAALESWGDDFMKQALTPYFPPATDQQHLRIYLRGSDGKPVGYMTTKEFDEACVLCEEVDLTADITSIIEELYCKNLLPVECVSRERRDVRANKGAHHYILPDDAASAIVRIKYHLVLFPFPDIILAEEADPLPTKVDKRSFEGRLAIWGGLATMISLLVLRMFFG